MQVHYVRCFDGADDVDKPLLEGFDAWATKADHLLSIERVKDRGELREHLSGFPMESLNCLVVGGHGHESLSGFWVGEEPLRWHDLAFLLRGRLARRCTFMFFSCNGGYPGISHAFGRNTGPDYVFGPAITVRAGAMTHAVMRVIEWKEGESDQRRSSARALVDKINVWARDSYPSEPDYEAFLRVMWDEGPRSRYPKRHGADGPEGSVIPLLGWGL